MKKSEKEHNTVSIEQMFGDNIEHIKDIKEIIEMHTLCIKKLTSNQQLIDQKISDLYKLVNKGI